MLDIKFIRENKDLIKQNCANRRIKVDIDKLVALDEERRSIIINLELARANKNKQVGKSKPTPGAILEMKKMIEYSVWMK